MRVSRSTSAGPPSDAHARGRTGLGTCLDSCSITDSGSSYGDRTTWPRAASDAPASGSACETGLAGHRPLTCRLDGHTRRKGTASLAAEGDTSEAKALCFVPARGMLVELPVFGVSESAQRSPLGLGHRGRRPSHQVSPKSKAATASSPANNQLSPPRSSARGRVTKLVARDSRAATPNRLRGTGDRRGSGTTSLDHPAATQAGVGVARVDPDDLFAAERDSRSRTAVLAVVSAGRSRGVVGRPLSRRCGTAALAAVWGGGPPWQWGRRTRVVQGR